MSAEYPVFNNEKKDNDNKVMKKKSPQWFDWWTLDDDEIKKQVENYEKTPIYLSYRGIAVILLLIFLIINIFFQEFSIVMFYVVLSAVFGVFILLGNRFFIVLAMIWWTIEKGYTAFNSLISQPVNIAGVGMSVVFWALFLRFLYHALAVENLRHKEMGMRNQKNEAEEAITENKIIEDSTIKKSKVTVKGKNFCKKCGNKLDKDSDFCDGCGSKI